MPKLRNISPPRVATLNESIKALDYAFEVINQLIDQVNNYENEVDTGKIGSPGAVRVILDKTTGKSYIEGRTENGWQGIELGESVR